MSLLRDFLLILVLLGLAAAVHADSVVDSDQWTRKYDRHFRKYTKHYFGPYFDWRWFKAQSITESLLNPNAKSPAGAKGLMQIMPATYEEIKLKNPHFFSIDTPKWNIAAGIYYDQYLYRKWQRGFSTYERLALMFGSYNAGPSSIRRAYGKSLRKYSKVNKWSQMAEFTPTETQDYVRKIRGYMRENND